LAEVKGSELRKAARSPRRREWRHSLGVLDKVFDVLEACECRVLARVWVKNPGDAFNGTSVYTFSVQRLLANFQAFLHIQGPTEQGIVVCDGRTKRLNVGVAHSIFTQKHQVSGDEYPSIVDLPTFGHSDNHAGLQMADFLVSSLLFPMAAHAYCSVIPSCPFVSPYYERLRARYRARLQALQYRYQDAHGHWRGGVTVSDRIARRPGTLLFSRP